MAQIMLQPPNSTDIDKAAAFADSVSKLCHDERSCEISDNSGSTFQKVGQILVIRHNGNNAAVLGSTPFPINPRPLLRTRLNTARNCTLLSRFACPHVKQQYLSLSVSTCQSQDVVACTAGMCYDISDTCTCTSPNMVRYSHLARRGKITPYIVVSVSQHVYTCMLQGSDIDFDMCRCWW